MRQGFTLVELSIVLVIIGLLAGGVMVGQTLIRASELRKVTRNVEQFRSSSMAFRDKYQRLPGDTPNATSFWGKNTINCNSAAGSAGTPGTCNGDGDGIMGLTGTGETRLFWQHMALAGLIEGSFTLPASGGFYQQQLFGTETPTGPFTGTGYFVTQLPTGFASSEMVYFAARNKPMILYAGSGAYPGYTTINHIGLGGSYNALSPEDALNIDVKIDEGRPGIGSITTQRYSDNGVPTAQTCTTSTDETIAVYTTQSGRRCDMVFSLY